MKIAIFLFLIGAALWGYSLNMPPYKDENSFQSQYMKMNSGMSEQYWALREQMLTPKYTMEDYGISLILAGVIFMIIGRKKVMPPKKAWQIRTLAIFTPILFVLGYVFDLLQANERGEFPFWADSLAIPLMGVPFLVVILELFSLIQLLFVRRLVFVQSPIFDSSILKANYWLLFMAAAFGTFFATSVAFGQYWYAVPMAAWVYYFLSLATIRKSSAPN